MSEALHGSVLGQKSYSQFFSEHPGKGDRTKTPGHTWSRTAHDRSQTALRPVQFSETGAFGMGTGYRSGGWSMHEISTPPHPCLHVPPRPTWALDLPSAILGGPGRQALGELLLAVRQARSSRRYWSKVAVRLSGRLVIPRAWGADSVALFPRGTAAFLGTVRRGLGSVG